jgi:uncharacterized protein (DUF4415 family)
MAITYGAPVRKATKTVKVKHRPGRPLSAKVRREVAALASRPSSDIDFSDIPELPPGAWKDAVRGRFYRLVKQAISLRGDADVVAWLKQSGKGLPDPGQSNLAGTNAGPTTARWSVRLHGRWQRHTERCRRHLSEL